ncbi:hypothetical protein BGZ76_001687 [Entomortierella beljakovae]|nr:hypothetical protein BGZ76_001687 [Entomortierella beljakovae]
MSQQNSTEKPKVIIVGAGIAGLMLGILFEQINAPYHIYEGAIEVKPLAFSRPQFYNILKKRVPEEKISFNKKVVDIEEKDDKVTIKCSDGTSYSGDILIGADGAHSKVRKSMYEQMHKNQLLPERDLEGFSVGHTIIVGVGKPANPENYPGLRDEHCNFSQIIYNGDSNCFVITVGDNQVGWGFGTQLESATTEGRNNAEWGPEENDITLNAFRDYPSPIGGTMGEIFDSTPKELISKVYLEEKIFETWYHGRTVLLGDACHKLHPAGGQGARNAINDAVTLANCIYHLEDNSSKSIDNAFKYYYELRYQRAETAFKGSNYMSKVLNGQKWYERIIRTIFLNYIPTWYTAKKYELQGAYRPQISWLPLAKNMGTGFVLPQSFKNTYEDDKNSHNDSE